MGTLWAGLSWARRGGWRRAALLGLLCGAGLYAKLLFIWIIGGLIGALTLLNVYSFVMSAWPRANRQPFRLLPRPPTAPDLIALTVLFTVSLALLALGFTVFRRASWRFVEEL